MCKVKHLLVSVTFLWVFWGIAIISTFAQGRKIEFMPRAGFSVLKNYGGRTDGGYNIGGMISVPLTERFSISVTPSFNSVGGKDHRFSALLLPVYASYQVPIQDLDLHFHIGPHGQLGDQHGFGVSAEVGLEYRKWYLGGYAFQNLVTSNDVDAFFGISLGYKFK